MPMRICIVVFAVCSAVLPAPNADAQGVAFAVFNGPYSHAELQMLDLETGELVPVGAIGLAITHIAFDRTENLYGVDFGSGHLSSIDAMTGSGTVIGPLGAMLTDVRGLAFTDDGRLWMAARDETLGPSLFEIETDTGTATWFAGLPEGYFGSLAGIGGTLLLGSYSLAEMDIATGVITPLPLSDFGLWSTRAMDFDDLGTLWGLMLCGPCMGPADVLTVRSIDRTTGTVEGDGPYEPHGTWGLAILPGALFVNGFESGDTSDWSGTVG